MISKPFPYQLVWPKHSLPSRWFTNVRLAAAEGRSLTQPLGALVQRQNLTTKRSAKKAEIKNSNLKSQEDSKENGKHRSPLSTETQTPPLRSFLPPGLISDEKDVPEVARFDFRRSRLPTFIVSDLNDWLLTVHAECLKFGGEKAIFNLWKAIFHRILVRLEPVLHTSPRGFDLDDPLSSQGMVYCSAKEPRVAHVAMIMEFKRFTLHHEKKFARFLTGAKECYQYNQRHLGVNFPIFVVFRLYNMFHFACYNPDGSNQEFQGAQLPGGEFRPMLVQRPHRPPTIPIIRAIAECFYHFLIQSYIRTLEANNNLEQSTPSEELQYSISLAFGGLRQTEQADVLCDRGLNERADAMAETGFYSLARSCGGEANNRI